MCSAWLLSASIPSPGQGDGAGLAVWYRNEPRPPPRRCEERALRAITRSVALERGWAGDGAAGIEDRIDATRYVNRLMEAVIGLPADDRDLLVLVAWEGWPHGEVARILGIPEGTVRSRLHRIRRQLSAATGGVTA